MMLISAARVADTVKVPWKTKQKEMQESVIDPSIKQVPATSPQSLHTLTAGPESSRPNKDPHYSVVTTHSVPLPFHPVPFPFPQAPSLSFSTCPPEATCLIRSSWTPNSCSPVSSHSLSPHLTFRPTHLLTCSPCPLISLQNIIIPFLGTPWRIVKDPIEMCPLFLSHWNVSITLTMTYYWCQL